MKALRKFKSWVEALGAALLVLAPVLALSADELSNIYMRFHNAGALTGVGGAGMFIVLLGIAALCVLIGGTLFLVNPLLQRWPHAPTWLIIVVGVAFILNYVAAYAAQRS